MKHVLALIFLLGSLYSRAFSPDTIAIVTHHKVLVVTDPAKGAKSYVAWGIFPDTKKDIRNIKMKVTLGCPDSIPCAHWDYLDHIYLRRRGIVNSKPLDYELGRMITPYGSIFQNGWQWSWKVDVSDFSSVLRDSVEIEYIHSGYEPATVGWNLTVAFEIITGEPAAEPISITRLWEGSYKYGDPKEYIEDKLVPIHFSAERNASFARLRIQQTGHGMDEPKGCSEFCTRYRDIRFDGKLIDHRNLWKKCGDNPLYPQGGTWIYNRGYWCPGDLQEADVFDVQLQKGDHSFDVDMEPYVATGNIQANESIASYLIQYRSPKNSNDMAIDQILSPNDDGTYQRKNPVCAEPHVIIRNLGREILNSAVIWYGTKGYPMRKHTWHGSLRFNETTDVWLEGPVNFKPGKNVFIVNATLPNGKKDQWDSDNTMRVQFDSPLVLPNKMVVQFRTNEHPSDNKISLIDAFGGIIYIREPSSFKPNTMYFDTLLLNKGCYELNLSDTAGNGLEFWFEPEQGHGFLRLLDTEGRLLYNFESDCGSGQHLAFSAIPGAVYDTTINRLAFSVYPLRVKDKLEFDCVASWPTDLTVLIKGAENQLLEKHEFLAVKNRITNIDINHLPTGRYFFEVQVNGEVKYKKRFNKE
ncbi:MAG: peptide-N-glycosidase [Bacteroidetes bacterium]|nr:peptide-N-glycosidase [Bacteroidota bacterium]